MARAYSADRASTVRAKDRAAPKSGIHPSICLVTGFGFIVASALAVHVLFNALI